MRWLRWLLPVNAAVLTEAGRVLLLPLDGRIRRRGVGRIRKIPLALTTPTALTDHWIRWDGR